MLQKLKTGFSAPKLLKRMSHPIISSLCRYYTDKYVSVKFEDLKNNSTKEVKLKIGENLMKEAKKHGIDIEAACEGSCACSTCHLILDNASYNICEEPSEKEDDMLDTAYGLTDTSRLSCQLNVKKEFDGKMFKIPKYTRNLI